MPSWQEFQPFIVTGLALGGVFALSGVGMVVLYRATGVLNLAFGAVGAMGALIAWQLINEAGLARVAGLPRLRPVRRGRHAARTGCCSARRWPSATRSSRRRRRSDWR